MGLILRGARIASQAEGRFICSGVRDAHIHLDKAGAKRVPVGLTVCGIKRKASRAQSS